MRKLPELFSLSKIEWQFFGTLTFREPSLRNRETGISNYRRIMRYHTFGREISRSLYFSRKNWKCVKFCLRLEQGEIGGLWHFHFLMSGLPPGAVNIGSCKFMQWVWSHECKGGFCKIRLFDSRQNGVEYISKCLDPADKYEFSKFGLAQALTFSPACVRELHKQGVARFYTGHLLNRSNRRENHKERSVLQMRVAGSSPGLKIVDESCEKGSKVAVTGVKESRKTFSLPETDYYPSGKPSDSNPPNGSLPALRG